MFTLNEVGKSGVLLFCAITIMASSADGQTDVMAALLKASRRGDLSALAESVKQGADINGSDRNGNTPLILAAEHGHFPAVRFLVDQGADVNRADNNERTPLMAACTGEIAEWLVAHGAKLEVTNSNGWTPLLYAAVHRSTPVIKSLVSKGAAVNAADRSGRTALMMLSDKGDRTAIEFLLANGADANLADNHGKTALMAAARNGRTLIAAVLIKHGADVTRRDAFGKTARDMAMEKKLVEMADLLDNPNKALDLLKRTAPIRLDDTFLAGLIDGQELKKIFAYDPPVSKKTKVLSGGRRGNVSIQGTVMNERSFSCVVNLELHESAGHAARICQAAGLLVGGAATGTPLDIGSVGDVSTATKLSTSSAILSFTVDHILVSVTLMAPEGKLGELGEIGRAVARRLQGESIR